jgi:hypothetical protein
MSDKTLVLLVGGPLGGKVLDGPGYNGDVNIPILERDGLHNALYRQTDTEECQKRMVLEYVRSDVH